MIDVFENDPDFGLRSARLLEERLGEALAVSPITHIEIAPAFEGDLVEQKRFLTQAGIAHRLGWTLADTEVAHAAWHRHLAARRSAPPKTSARRSPHWCLCLQSAWSHYP